MGGRARGAPRRAARAAGALPAGDRLERAAAADPPGARARGARRPRAPLERRRRPPGRLARDLSRRGHVPGVRRQVQAPVAPGRPPARLRGRRLVGSVRVARVRPRLRARPAWRRTSTNRVSRTSRTRRSSMSLLRFPEPYDFELSTGRFRAFGTDLANRLVDGTLYRAVGGREVRITARPGGVDVEPLDDETRPVVLQLLGAPFDLPPFYAWAGAGPAARADRRSAARLSSAAPARSVRGADHLDHRPADLPVRRRRDPQPPGRAPRRARRRGVGVPDPRPDRRGGRGRRSSTSASRAARPSTRSGSRAATSISSACAALDDDVVRARITALRGLGPWTAEWFLARHLARPHAWPAGDLALRKAAESLYGVAVTDLGARLHPFQNLSAHYLLTGWLTRP